MQPRVHNYVVVVGITVAIVCLASSGVVSDDPKQVLERRLVKIRAAGRRGTTDAGALEAQCLQLVKDHNTPAGKGMIYATIALVYCERGFGRSDERRTRVAKTLEYAKKALEHPLDVLSGCRMQGRLADAIIISAWRGPRDKWIQARRQAVAPCLRGLKLAMDNKAPKDRPDPPPMVPLPHIISPNGGRAYQEKHRRYEQYVVACREYRHLCELHNQRRALTRRCVTLYSEEPHDTEEFRGYAQKMLVGYEDVVQDLTAQVEAAVAAKEWLQPPGSSRRNK